MGGDDTLTAPWHFPLPELLPISRPEASRRVVVVLPWPWELSVPVRRPEASRNWVRLPLPANPLVVALPAASRADLGRGGADDPPGRIADQCPLGAARLLLAINGLNHAPRTVTNHLPAGLGGGEGGEKE